MLPLWTNALTTVPPVILGRRLKPFSLGHYAVLMAIESPLRQGPVQTRDPSALAVAAWICSMDATEVAGVDPAAAQALFEDWARDQAATADWKAQERALITYIGEQSRYPEMFTPEGGRNYSSPVPVFAHIHATLVLDGHQDWRVAWNMPIAQAISLYVQLAERRGAELVSESDQREIERQLRELKKKAKRGRRKAGGKS